jgi:hypothetical protein
LEGDEGNQGKNFMSFFRRSLALVTWLGRG